MRARADIISFRVSLQLTMIRLVAPTAPEI